MAGYPWTQEEKDFLKQNLDQPTQWLSKQIGRSTSAIRKQLIRMHGSSATTQRDTEGKVCIQCRLRKPLDAFEKKGNRHGTVYRDRCIACCNAPEDTNPPCETCGMKTYCARTGMSCRGFTFYVETGRTPQPSAIGWRAE